VINADPDGWYHGDPQSMGRENYEEWREATRSPDAARGMLEDYRAGLTIEWALGLSWSARSAGLASTRLLSGGVDPR
jgi:hypothetical protein